MIGSAAAVSFAAMRGSLAVYCRGLPVPVAGAASWRASRSGGGSVGGSGRHGPNTAPSMRDRRRSPHVSPQVVQQCFHAVEALIHAVHAGSG